MRLLSRFVTPVYSEQTLAQVVSTMSMFRACTRSSLISRRTGLSISQQIFRYTSTEATPTAEKKANGEITIPPTRDVLVADVISGAPGVFSMII